MPNSYFHNQKENASADLKVIIDHFNELQTGLVVNVRFSKSVSCTTVFSLMDYRTNSAFLTSRIVTDCVFSIYLVSSSTTAGWWTHSRRQNTILWRNIVTTRPPSIWCRITISCLLRRVTHRFLFRFTDYRFLVALQRYSCETSSIPVSWRIRDCVSWTRPWMRMSWRSSSITTISVSYTSW